MEKMKPVLVLIWNQMYKSALVISNETKEVKKLEKKLKRPKKLSTKYFKNQI